MAHADVSDIDLRMPRVFSETEAACAESLSYGASAVLDKLVKLDGSAEQEQLLNFVCVNMVCRAISALGFDVLGASQATMTAGSYTQSYSFGTPSGDMYLTKLEKRMLGITQGYIGTIPAEINGYYGVNDD